MQEDSIPALVRISAGEFVMGSDDSSHDDERPAHRVYLDEYEIGIHPVTNDQYARFVREAGHRAPGIYDLPLVVTRGGREREREFRQLAVSYVWTDGAAPAGRGGHPVTLVQYEDAMAYCRWLARRAGRPFRLPTEAEWEKAARGGLEGRRYPWGDEIEPGRAHYLDDPAKKLTSGTRAVGLLPANAYGLFDVTGNVWEWVADWFAPDYYASSPGRNPRGSDHGRLRIVRGGAWLDTDVNLLRCAYRHKVPPDTYAYSIGFRVVCAERRRDEPATT